MRPEAVCATMAFTTFVLFQFFNVSNARSESSSALNARFFDNRMLWLSLSGTLTLRVVAVHWMPASQLFGTTDMAWADWGVAISVASICPARVWTQTEALNGASIWA
jgi:Ca2+-transporting ATPase